MQFRKSTSIFLAFFILFSNLGLAFNVHYCKNKIAGISLSTQEKESCVEVVKSCCITSEASKNCCLDEIVKVEKKSDDILTKIFQFDVQQYYTLNTTEVFENLKGVYFVKKESPSSYCNSNAPPFHKLYCQLVFYA